MHPPLQAAALAVLLQINYLFNNRKSSVLSICLTEPKLNIYFILFFKECHFYVLK